MTNREHAIRRLRDLVDAHVALGGALGRAFYMLDKAAIEKRDLDNRELAIIDILSSTIPTESIAELNNKGTVE